MKVSLTNYALFSAFLMLLTSVALAEGGQANSSGYRSKYGFDVKGYRSVVPPSGPGGVGWLAGLRTGRFVGTSNVHITLNGYFGTPNGLNPSREQLYYGTIGFGYDGRMSRIFLFEGGLQLGYGEGKIDDLGIKQISYYVVEPSFGVGFPLGNGWRLIFSASFIHMTNADRFSGGTFGIRFDFKTQTVTKDIND